VVWAGIPGAVAQSYNQVRADAKLASSKFIAKSGTVCASISAAWLSGLEGEIG
jgi:hypothetical protein